MIDAKFSIGRISRMLNKWPETDGQGFIELAKQNPVIAPDFSIDYEDCLCAALRFLQDNSRPINIYAREVKNISHAERECREYIRNLFSKYNNDMPECLLDSMVDERFILTKSHHQTLMNNMKFATTMPAGTILWHGFSLTPKEDWCADSKRSIDYFMSLSFNIFCGLEYARFRSDNHKGRPAILQVTVNNPIPVYSMIGMRTANSDYSWQQEVVALPVLKMHITDQEEIKGTPKNKDLTLIKAKTI